MGSRIWSGRGRLSWCRSRLGAGPRLSPMPATTRITRLAIGGHRVPVAAGALMRDEILTGGQAGHTSWSAQAVVTGPPRDWPAEVTGVEIEAGGETLVGRGRVWQHLETSGTELLVPITIAGDGDLEPKISE